MKTLLKEPLLHFLALGGAIFAFNGWREETRPAAPSPERIEVSALVIERLRAGYERQYGQPPDVKELQGLVTAHIKEEVLSREALALGLDRDDTIVRRRLAQKMEFLTNDMMAAVKPDDAAVAKFFTEHEVRYMKPGVVTFRHVYFNKEKRGPGVAGVVAESLTALEKGAMDDTLGDPFLHGYAFAGREEDEVGAMFGPDFARQLKLQPVGEWRGPVASSYGLHLVLVEQRAEPRVVKLEEVRAAVLRDFQEEQREATNRDVFEKLRARYEVTVDDAAMAKAASRATRTAQR